MCQVDRPAAPFTLPGMNRPRAWRKRRRRRLASVSRLRPARGRTSTNCQLCPDSAERELRRGLSEALALAWSDSSLLWTWLSSSCFTRSARLRLSRPRDETARRARLLRPRRTRTAQAQKRLPSSRSSVPSLSAYACTKQVPRPASVFSKGRASPGRAPLR